MNRITLQQIETIYEWVLYNGYKIIREGDLLFVEDNGQLFYVGGLG